MNRKDFFKSLVALPFAAKAVAKVAAKPNTVEQSLQVLKVEGAPKGSLELFPRLPAGDWMLTLETGPDGQAVRVVHARNSKTGQSVYFR